MATSVGWVRREPEPVEHHRWAHPSTAREGRTCRTAASSIPSAGQIPP